MTGTVIVGIKLQKSYETEVMAVMPGSPKSLLKEILRQPG
jgi:hypothetical protein